MSKSKIEQLICSKEFSYLQPYFYNNEYALRCELGAGNEQQYLINAKKRATEIFNIIFPVGADAIIFNYWMFDYSNCGQAEKNELQEHELDMEETISNRLESETKQLKFLLEKQMKYRHYTVRDLETYGDFDDEYIDKLRRNRVICYRDDEEFDYSTIIDQEISGNGHNVGFVSFQNECILSVYDDRGCDIVFATREKLKEFYYKLEPYFLSHDEEEMKKRLNG